MLLEMDLHVPYVYASLIIANQIKGNHLPSELCHHISNRGDYCNHVDLVDEFPYAHGAHLEPLFRLLVHGF